jgi:hypothetical protein
VDTAFVPSQSLSFLSSFENARPPTGLCENQQLNFEKTETNEAYSMPLGQQGGKF